MTQRLLGPFNRVEGDLEVRIDIEDGVVCEAHVSSPLYRGFERILKGKDPRDALVYAPRICGICSVSQSVAAARAIAMVQGLKPVENGRLTTDLTLAIENIVDHLTHFYMFFMPDFCRETYVNELWFHDISLRFKAGVGEAQPQFLSARAAFMNMLGILAGKWPHTLSVQPGGSTRPIEEQERQRLGVILHAFRKYLERQVFGDRLENFAALSDGAALDAWIDRGGGDLRRFLKVARLLSLSKLGRACDRFLSYGSFGRDDLRLFNPGVFVQGCLHPLQQELITEDHSHGWIASENKTLHPYDGETQPDAGAPAGYTWCKAPRLVGQTMEVGAFARQVVDGQPLARALVASEGGNVHTRILGRFIEIVRLVPAMEGWVKALRPKEPFCETIAVPAQGRGYGLVEAARGALGHWLRVDGHRIENYQIIAPTTWNFSPRDANGQPGPLEQALVGAAVRDGEKDPVSVQHIVRSFDPCMVCTVH